MMMLGIPIEKPFPSTSENKRNTLMVIQDWQLGPERPSNERGANGEYWRGLAKAMQVDDAEARRRRCSNCEYYDNTPDTQLKMERIPLNQWDAGAGFRGFCTKFRFVCHDLRSCQAWAEKGFECK